MFVAGYSGHNTGKGGSSDDDYFCCCDDNDSDDNPDKSVP
jgi:hypothetical protein